MINAVLYSDQIIPANTKVDLLLLEMIERRGNRIGYIPSGPDPDGRFFDGRKAYYARYGLRLAMAYDLDQDHGQAELEDLLACDAIHLSGGDTTAFLRRMIGWPFASNSPVSSSISGWPRNSTPCGQTTPPRPVSFIEATMCWISRGPRRVLMPAVIARRRMAAW